MTRRRFLAGLGAAACVAVESPSRARAATLGVRWRPDRGLRQGDVAWVEVEGGAGLRLTGTLGAVPIGFFAWRGGHAAVVGIDLDTHPGPHRWRITVASGAEPVSLDGTVAVLRREFSVEHLTLPPAMVDLDPSTERRALAEAEEVRSAVQTVTPERLWRGPFARPVAVAADGRGFGARRVINGKPRMPHGGTDYPAPFGTAVTAANAGRVALVGEHFFPGRLVILDHGLGLHTLYFHLDAVTAVGSQRVERGEPIGTVGATGRATGPHLHFAAQVGGARVDPAALLGLPLAG